MKERMEALKKTTIDLAEFFCEDGNAFKLDECYKSLASFCTKFKQAVTENVKRKAQEDLQENRRAQRELEEQKKSKSGRPTTYLSLYGRQKKQLYFLWLAYSNWMHILVELRL